MSALVDYELRDGAAHVTLSDPDHGNSITPASVAQLHAAVRRARLDDARVVVLRGLGKAFSVGGDVGTFATAEDPDQLVEDLAEALHRTISDLHRMDAVVVAVVAGTAAGAGVPLAAAADLVLAGESARFTLAYTRIGLSPDGGSTLLTASLGLHRALHLALLNPVLSAAEAQVAGLVAQVHPDDGLAAAAEAVVAQLLAGSRPAQVSAKRLLREVATPGAEAALRQESLAIRANASGPDGREGVAAFAAKRRPDFPSTRG